MLLITYEETIMPIAATLQMEHPALLQALSFYLLAHGDPISMAEMLWQMYLLKNTENAYPECFIKANFGQISLTEGHYDHVDALYHYKLNMHGDFTAAKIFDKESELCEFVTIFDDHYAAFINGYSQQHRLYRLSESMKCMTDKKYMTLAEIEAMMHRFYIDWLRMDSVSNSIYLNAWREEYRRLWTSLSQS